MFRLTLTCATASLALLTFTPPASAAWEWPLRGEVITPYSNGDDPYAGGRHRGIDIAGEVGQPVVAATSGTVRFAGTVGSSGLTVSIRTLDGFDTSYLHLSAVFVRDGETVAGGARIGAVGTTGVRSAERPHLHFGVREAGSRHAYVDPLSLLAPPPAGEGPRAVPAPSPAPVPLAPAPDRVRVPAPEPVPNGRVRAPATRSVRRRAPSELPRRAERPEAALEPMHQAQTSNSARPAGVPDTPPATDPRARREHAHPRPGALERLGPARAPAARPRPGTAPSHPEVVATPAPGRQTGERPDPDLGLLLACLGVLGAAALLGLSEDGREATRRSGRRAAQLLRPILLRR
jgi:hypothetical protein